METVDRGGAARLASRLGQWVVDLQYEQLPAEVVRRAKQCLFDQLGVQLRGASLPQVQPAAAMVRAMGGVPEATVVRGQAKTPVAYAAFVNGTFGHSCEFDDSHFDCGHPGVCVIPAALALAERERVDGKALITAIVAGYQAQATAVGPIHRGTLTLGWHGTKIGGVFGAAAASAKLLGLDAERTTHALSVAASEASGMMEYDQSGGEVKRVHAGAASRAGVQAALLAQAGLTGPREVFEGKRGLYRLFGDGQPPQVDRFWQGRYLILDTMFKLYPAVGTAHAALNALTEIQRRRTLNAADIESIRVGLAGWAILHGAAIRRPTDAIGAQFSLAFSLALRVVEGRNDLDLYLDPARWADPRLLRVIDLVQTHPIEFAPGESELGARVEVCWRDGSRLSHRQLAPRGAPQNPADDGDLRDKFRGLVAHVLPDGGEALMALVFDLERLDDVSMLTRQLG